MVVGTDTGFSLASRRLTGDEQIGRADQTESDRPASVCDRKRQSYRQGRATARCRRIYRRSLAKNSFKAHSDIDLLVHGSAAPHRRAMVERLVAEHLRGTGLPYDLIFEADLTEERLKEMLHDLV